MTAMFDVKNVYKQANEIIEEMAKGKVNYYWETIESSPVLEVFVTGGVNEVEEKKHEIMTTLDAMNIKDGVQVDYEELREKYYRLMILMDLKCLTEKQVQLMINVLKHYGEATWKDKDHWNVTEYVLNHIESKSVLYMADEIITKEFTYEFYQTEIVKTILNNTVGEDGKFKEDMQLEMIIKIME